MRKSRYEVKNGKVYAIISELTDKELAAVKNYVALGYDLVPQESKKKTKTIEDMRTELAADEETLKKFNEAYKTKAPKGNKDFNETGFAKAVKIYNDWVKDNKEK